MGSECIFPDAWRWRPSVRWHKTGRGGRFSESFSRQRRERTRLKSTASHPRWLTLLIQLYKSKGVGCKVKSFQCEGAPAHRQTDTHHYSFRSCVWLIPHFLSQWVDREALDGGGGGWGGGGVSTPQQNTLLLLDREEGLKRRASETQAPHLWAGERKKEQESSNTFSSEILKPLH